MPDHSFDLPVQLTDFDIDIASVFLLALCNYNGNSGTVEFGDFAKHLSPELTIDKKRQRFDSAIDRITNQILAGTFIRHQQSLFTALSVDMFTSSLFGLDSKVTITINDLIVTSLKDKISVLPSLMPLIEANSVGCIALYCELTTRPINTDIVTIKRPRLDQILVVPNEVKYNEVKDKYLLPALDLIFSVTGQHFEVTTEMKSGQTTKAVVFKEVYV